MAGNGEELRSHDSFGTFFDRRFQQYTEPSQQNHTFRR